MSTLQRLRSAALLAILAVASSGATLGAEPLRFATPDEAALALVDACRRNDSAAITRLYGESHAGVTWDANDPGVEAARAQLAAAADDVLLIEVAGPDRATIVIGKEAFPFPIPLVRSSNGWHFDAAAGAEELADRRIGLNELMTMTALESLVELQSTYEAQPRDDSGVRQYARRFISTPGTQDGLYWESAAGAPPSPLGPMFASTDSGRPDVYYGYRYRMLGAQGANAPGGAYDYLINGRLLGGHAAIAWPDRYGETGVMSFIVNRYGVVYQKDLGPQSSRVAAAIATYDPDGSWTPARTAAASR
jgi:hypothetical protein